jgi:hypothetical protein
LIEGYLNIDRAAFTEIPNGTEYFAFNFAERSWPIPDASVARLIGYRQAIFTAKGKGTFAVADTRPGIDRDELTGNIMVDLLK